MSTKPTVAATTPSWEPLEPGKTYQWCACGLSKKQPYCDGSHAGTEFSPLAFSVEEAGKKPICWCKATKKPPYCDGAHNNIS
ncbi:MAG: CDGSH iron-sulfur domain-containing protein [Sinobacterium sp.]|nr:CDGSH iron-sulfur domain-containing protein [Sinobacterium sp.]